MRVNAGTFIMGGSEYRRADENPLHSVTLSAFRLSEKEITNEQYCRFLNARGIGSNRPGIGFRL